MIFTLFLSFPVLVCLIMGLILLTNREGYTKNRFFLGLFMIGNFILFTGHFLYFKNLHNVFMYYDFLFLFALLSIYPLYYLYIRSIFNNNCCEMSNAIHFAPAFFVAFLNVLFLVSSDKMSFLVYLQHISIPGFSKETTSRTLEYIYDYSRYFHIAQIFIYSYFSYLTIKENYPRFEKYFSTLDKFQIQYFKLINLSFILLMAIPGVIVTIMNRGVILEDMRLAGVFSFCFTLIYAILGIYGIKQVSMKKYKTDYLDKDVEKFELIKNRLVDYVVEDKAFLNPQLNIVDVARNINSNRTYISNIVNKEFGMNFNNFVNHYRVEHAKKLIGEDENNSHCIEYIYENSGFGSEISFIRAFKKFEKENPSAYRKSLNSDK